MVWDIDILLLEKKDKIIAMGVRFWSELGQPLPMFSNSVDKVNAR
jgi:hypothetical protein